MDATTFQMLNSLAQLCGANCCIFNHEAKSFENGNLYCEHCEMQCDYKNTHSYGCLEAGVRGGPFQYYCQHGYLFIAVPADKNTDDKNFDAIIGPILPCDDNSCSDVPSLSNTQIRTLRTVLTQKYHSNASYYGSVKDNRGPLIVMNQIYKSIDSSNTNSKELRSLEKKLQNVINEKNADGAECLLSELAAQILAQSNGDVEKVRPRVLEMTVLISRAAVDLSGEAELIFALSAEYIREINRLDSADLLVDYLHDFFKHLKSIMFDFSTIKHNDTICKITTYIKSNYMKKISLDDLSDYVYMSKSYISKIFRDEMKCSITEYVNSIRINESKRLLSDRSLSIADVSYLTGFADQSYFTKVFIKNVGMSPGKFREISRPENQ